METSSLGCREKPPGGEDTWLESRRMSSKRKAVPRLKEQHLSRQEDTGEQAAESDKVKMLPDITARVGRGRRRPASSLVRFSWQGYQPHFIDDECLRPREVM